MSAFAKFYFRPQKGEEIQTVAVPKDDERCGIFGRIIDSDGAVVEDALVALFEAEGKSKGELLASAFSDSEGEFMFGPLESDRLYLVRVCVNNLKLRELEISL